MTITYNKLVRDRIPEIIKLSGKKCSTEILSDGALQSATGLAFTVVAHIVQIQNCNNGVIRHAISNHTK